MLTHHNLLANCYQFLAPGEDATFTADEVVLCFLPLYHIYGLNVILNPLLLVGGTNVLMPRFDCDKALALLSQEEVTMVPVVPPVLNALCVAAEAGKFPHNHCVRYSKCGAAPLASRTCETIHSIDWHPRETRLWHDGSVTRHTYGIH